MLDALILSDLHLGSDNCQAKRIGRQLERIVDGELLTRRLILNGDVFDSIDFRRLTKSHWKVLSLVRKLSDDVEVIWLAGNHDGSADIVSHLLGVTVMDEFILETADRRILILHGHKFDAFLDKHPWMTWMADCVYGFLQWIDPTHAVAKWAKHRSKTFLRCAQKIEDGAIEYARRNGCDAVCCGHTHVAVARTEGPVSYFNSGCWTELPCSYLTIQAGSIRMHTYQPETVPAPAAVPLPIEVTVA
jgi:UDP-2,3-diacylglucosamine pyrophosphatase LpxH